MYITKLYIRNFRNIREAEFDFDKNLNVFVGRNAQGKTNLCEAISVCLGGSFRRVRFSQYIPADSPKAEVRIKLYFYDDNNTERENIIDYTIRKNSVVITYNGIKIKDAAELYGVLKYVVFIPEHLNIIKGSPELRRDYLDNVALMQTQTHLKKLSRYNKGLKQRNNLLSVNYDIDALKPMLASWNDVLATEGINVTYGRLKYFTFLKAYAAKIFGELTDGSEKLTMKYNSTVFKTADTDSIDFQNKHELYKKYISELEKNLSAEMKLHYTLVGIHRDDVEFYINDMFARDFASQGQIRSIALALKLSEAEIIRRKNKTNPVIILDDILSELDSVRRNFVIHHIENSQVFITCCNQNELTDISNGKANGKAWNTENGSFTSL